MPVITPGSTPASMSELNRARVVQYLYSNGVSSRAQIAKALSLTPAAITKITGKLIELGIVHETGDLTGKKNRRSIGLEVNASDYLVIGVKFDRSNISIGLFDIGGTQLSHDELPSFGKTIIPQTVETVRRHVRKMLNAHPSVVAIGMTTPGPYLRPEGHTAKIASSEWWTTINFITEFSDAFDVPVFIEQDARASAMAESLFDHTVTSKNMTYYLLGEGIGAGVIDHGELVNGTMGAATEIGHISLNVDGEPCGCGNRGCLENYCSAIAFHRLINESKLIEGSENMTHEQACRAIFDLARQNDENAMHLVRDLARYIGYGCVIIINAYNSEQIVLGGMLAEAGKPLLDEVTRIVRMRVIPEVMARTQIQLSALDTDPTLSGAAAVATAHFLEHPSAFQPN